MNPQFPFKTRWQLTQNYYDNFNNYPEGHHGGLDIVPFGADGKSFPAEIFPVLDGSEISIELTDVKRGKGIKVRTAFNTEKDKDFTDYLKRNNVFPNYTGDYKLDFLYWHVLDGIDIDGTADQAHSIAHAGNTGWVFSGGVAVPDSEKGVPPYKGLHLHLECSIIANVLFNTNLDPRGRFDPQIILNYKGDKMSNAIFVKRAGTSEAGFYIPASSEEALKDKALNLGLNILKDGHVDYTVAKEIAGL